jgi:hypothetical protein
MAKDRRSWYIAAWISTAWVLGSDSPGKVAQWLARSIRESCGGLWLVIRLLSVRADVSSCYRSILPCTAFPSTLVSMLELSTPLPVLLLLRVGGLSLLNTRAVRLKTASGKSTAKTIHVGHLRLNLNPAKLSRKQCYQKQIQMGRWPLDIPMPRKDTTHSDTWTRKNSTSSRDTQRLRNNKLHTNRKETGEKRNTTKNNRPSDQHTGR